MRPLLSILSRAHEHDDRFTLKDQFWTDAEDQLVTKWSFAAAVLYALTVITSTGVLLLEKKRKNQCDSVMFLIMI